MHASTHTHTQTLAANTIVLCGKEIILTICPINPVCHWKSHQGDAQASAEGQLSEHGVIADMELYILGQSCLNALCLPDHLFVPELLGMGE